MKKLSWFWLIGLMVGLYNAFIVQNFWNWFVIPAFHASEIPYWGIYGLLMLISLVADRGDEFASEHRWKVILTVVDACVPDEKKLIVEESLKQQTDTMWIDLGSKVFGKLVGNTATLAIGWGIHAFIV